MARVLKKLHFFVCSVCGKEKWTHDPAHARKALSCSIECRGKTKWAITHRRPRLPRAVCPCGKTVAEAHQRYCSLRCAGLARTDVRGNKYAFMGDDAGGLAFRVRARKICPAGPCAVCGAFGEIVHHVDHNYKNNDPSNLQRMCRPCHGRHHHGKSLTQTSDTVNITS
jgi:hypothetical protein